MYNIHNHYQNIFDYLKTIIAQPKIAYLYPFGASAAENIEVLDTPNSYDIDPVVLCYDQEPLLHGYNDPVFERVKNELTVGGRRPVILLNTELDSEEKNHYLEKYGFIDAYCFFHIFAAHDWYRGYQYNKSIKPVRDRAVKKAYISFNRLTGSARIYRSMLVAELSKNDILSRGHVSYSDICPDHGPYKDNLLAGIERYNLPADYVTSTIAELDRMKFPLRIDFKNDEYIPNHSMALSAIPECMESFIYVVTETCYWEKKKHLTEKIFKPIILKQPFVLLGCAHNLEYLRSYGFKTFGDFWDESYDTIEDPVQRLQAVVEILKKFSQLTNGELTYMLHEMQEILEYNYNLFNSKEFLDNAWAELENNLAAAIKACPSVFSPISSRV